MTYPALRSFLQTAAEKLASKEVTLAELTSVLDSIAMGEGLDENEKAMAARLEALGVEDNNPHNGASPEYRRGFADGFSEGFLSAEEAANDNGRAALTVSTDPPTTN